MAKDSKRKVKPALSRAQGTSIWSIPSSGPKAAMRREQNWAYPTRAWRSWCLK